MNSYLIWSFEHRAWWKPDGFGYTLALEKAGRFTLELGAAFVESANRYRPFDDPFEALVPLDEVSEFRATFSV